MIIGYSRIGEKLKAPKGVRAMGYSTQIEVETCKEDWLFKMKLGVPTPDWIACRYAMPHVDGGYRDQMFLTLSLGTSGEHRIGDAINGPGELLHRGHFFAVDPLVTHWLVADRMWKTAQPVPWVGLQWIFDRRSFKRQAAKVLKAFGTVQIQISGLDKRYSALRASLPSIS